MPARYHTLALLLSIALAYLWLQVPVLRNYSFQIFALFVAGFFFVKRFKKAKLWHILPDVASFEITLITFSFLLLIGATGNTQSYFFPLGYIHLFFLVMASEAPTAIVATITIMLFHYSIEPSLSLPTVQGIITLPIMLSIFLFAKKQYDEAHLNKIAAQRLEKMRKKDHEQLEKVLQQDPSLRSTLAEESTQDSTTA